MARLYIARKKQHGGQGGNRYTVVESSEPQNSVESKTIEVVAEETGKSPDTVRKAYQR